LKRGEDKQDREKNSELVLLVVRTFEVIEVLEGDLLEDEVDGLFLGHLIKWQVWDVLEFPVPIMESGNVLEMLDIPRVNDITRYDDDACDEQIEEWHLDAARL
jgi:hypothetical protein